MNATIKIRGEMLDTIRRDLQRRHAHAWERVGFVTAAGATTPSGIMLLARDYTPVADQDYEPAIGVGAQIGSDAMRKALQSAYRPQHALLHIHSHGGTGVPAFSGTDRRSAAEFVPSFFNTLPKMPHGIIVLSDNSASGLLWFAPDRQPVDVTRFIRVGAPYLQTWSST